MACLVPFPLVGVVGHQPAPAAVQGETVPFAISSERQGGWHWHWWCFQPLAPETLLRELYNLSGSAFHSFSGVTDCLT